MDAIPPFIFITILTILNFLSDCSIMSRSLNMNPPMREVSLKIVYFLYVVVYPWDSYFQYIFLTVPWDLEATLWYPCGSAGKESACNAGDLGSIPGLGRSPGEEKSYPLQYSGLENSMGLQRVRYDWATFTFTMVLPLSCICPSLVEVH